MSQGKLAVVATPIGNLSDMTFRAVAALKDADLIACEDTRRTLLLLNHYDVKKPLITVFGPKERKQAAYILRSIAQGKNVALVSDAGTPGLSDPGNLLVREARAQGLRVEPIPGASAGAALASVSGVCQDGFIFLGFLPRKKSKIIKELKATATAGKPLIFFESPFRVLETLEIAGSVFGEGCFCLVGREMTKKFEEFVSGSLAQVRESFAGREILGEFTVLLDPSATL